MDHRKYVGGNFNEAGLRQFDFLLDEGLEPYHYFLEIGFGCFRAGRYFISYLNDWNYFGIEQHQWLVDAGMEEIKDIDPSRFKHIVNSNFEFEKLSDVPPKFKYVLAKSVFTHLTPDKIKQCLNNLKEVLADDGVFYASIHAGTSKNNPT